ncbi:CU044_5270 family protein [Nonomuraea sp. NPDC003754]
MSRTDVMKGLSKARPAALTPPDDPARLERIIAAAAVRPPAKVAAPRRRRTTMGWGLTAGALAAGLTAVVVLTPGTAGDQGVDPAVRGMLLTAAEQTMKTPQTAGRYWHTRGVNSGARFSERRTQGVCRDETWVARSPEDPSWWIVHSWTRVAAVDGAPPPQDGVWSSTQEHFVCARGNRELSDPTGETPYASRLNSFAEPGSSWPNINGKAVSVAEIERLPTDPEELKRVLIQWQGDGVSEPRRTQLLVEQAAELLLELPAPAGVRAGLFRMMADLPGVRSLGGVRDPLGRAADGVALRTCEPGYGTDLQLLFDKDAGRLLSVNRSAGSQGCSDLRPAGWSAVLETGWTDESPELPANRS